MKNTFVCLIITFAIWLMLAQPATSQRAYGEVFAEDLGAVGCDPPSPPPTSPPPPWGWLSACPSVGTHRKCDCLEDSGATLQNALNGVPTDGTLRFQHCRYLTNRTLVVDRPLTIEVTGSDDRVTSCGFAVAYGIVGLHLKGFQIVEGHPVLGSSTIRGLHLHAYKRPDNNGPLHPEAHGILMEGTSHLAGVTVEQFEGDGIHIDADTNRSSNANQWRIDGGAAIHNQGVGLLVRGGDANAGVAVRFSSIGNLLANYHDNSGLGNTYIGCHSDFWTGSSGPTRSYESGWHYDNGQRKEDRTNHNLYLNCYQEDGQTADLAPNTIWIGGQSTAATVGKGSVLKTDGNGFQADHFAAIVGSMPVARLGALDHDRYMAEFWLPGAKKPLYVYPSESRPGDIDIGATPGAGPDSVALSLSTGLAPPLLDAPSGAKLGRARVFGATSKPSAPCNVGDLAINVNVNVVARPTDPWGWQCVGTAGNWRDLLPIP